MSSQLPLIDLTGASVGTVKTADFTAFVKFDPSQFANVAHLAVFNESGCGLNARMNQSGNAHYVPAGGWTLFEIAQNDSNVNFTVTYTLPNPPVSQVSVVYYAPGEQTPSSYTLGNSPIGIGGTVQTSSVQTLSNEGSAAGVLVIDTGDSAFSQLFSLFNDGHATWAVDQSGVKHQVIKVQTAGNPLQIGASGDTVENLGSELIDSNLTINAKVYLQNNSNLSRQFAAIQNSDNNPTLYTSSDNGILNIRTSAQSSIIGQFADGNLLTTLFGILSVSGKSTTINGATSGSVTINEAIVGALHAVIITFNGFANNSGADQDYTLLYSFSSGQAVLFGSDCANFAVKSGINKQNIYVLTTLAGTGGSTTTETTFQKNSLGFVINTFDHLSLVGLAGTTTHNGMILLLGQ